MRNAKRHLKKSVFLFVAFTTILWSISGLLLAPMPAAAAPTVSYENRLVGPWSMGAGYMIDVAAFNIVAENPGDELDAIQQLTFTDINSSGATPSDMLAPFVFPSPSTPDDNQGLCIYYDSNGNGFMDPGTDAVLSWAAEPTWTDNGDETWTTTLDVSGAVLPDTFTGSWNFFVHMKMAATPTAGKSFKLSFGTGSVLTYDAQQASNSPSITAFETGPISSMGGGGDPGSWVEPPRVSAVYYEGPSNYTIVFDKEMDSNTTDCANATDCANIYTLYTSYAGTTVDIDSATLQGGNTWVSLSAAQTAFAAPNYEDTLTITTDPTYAPKDSANSMSYQDDYPLNLTSRWSDVKISEVQIGGTEADDEFIEFYNSGSSAVDLTGWSLVIVNDGSPPVPDFPNLPAITLAAGEYALMANTNGAYAGSADALFPTSGTWDFDDDDSMQLLDSNSQTVDLLGWGSSSIIYEGIRASSPSAGQSLTRKATPSSTAATMSSGGADASNGNGYDSDDNSYDFVVVAAPTPQGAGTTATLTGYTNVAPTINHMPLSMAVANQELSIPAQIHDVEDTFTNLATKELCYITTGGDWVSETCVTGQMLADVIFSVPASAVTTSGVSYYIHVQDSDGADTYNSASPAATTQALAQTNAYTINVSSRGSRRISGTVYQSDCSTAIDGASVFVEGTGQNSTTDSNGVFSFTGLVDSVYTLRAAAANYLDSDIWGVSVNDYSPESTGWVFCLESGSAGQGGDGDAPRVTWTAPGDGMMGAPVDIVIDRMPILIGLDKEMDSSTITCTDCVSATSNIKLKKMVAGSVTDVDNYSVYLDTGSGVSARGYDFTEPSASTDFPAIVIDMVALLTKATDYIVEITPAVQDTSGNPVDGNRPGGGHSFMFTTMNSDWDFSGSTGGAFGFTEDDTYWETGDFTAMLADDSYMEMSAHYDADMGQWSGGAFNPPYIFGSVPAPGSRNIATNLDKVIFEFSEALDSNTINTANFELYTVSSAGVEAEVTATKVSSVALDTTSTIVTMNIDAAGLSEGQHRVKVKSGVRSSSGITLGPPENPDMIFYETDFNVGSSADSTAPSINGSYPDNAATDVPLDFGFMDIGFNEALDPSTVDGRNVEMTVGSSSVPATVSYDSMGQRLNIYPSSGLQPGGTYTITLTMGGSTGIKDLAGNPASATSLTRTFTMTTTMDTTQPILEFANCDDYTCAVTFSKPMNATRASESTSNPAQWNASILKSGNYALTYGPSGTGSTQDLTAATVSFSYEPEHNTVMIEGLALTSDQQFILTITGVKDIMGNPIDTNNNATQGPVDSSAETMGFMGPGGGGFMGPPPEAGGMMGGPTGFGGFGAGEAMMMGAGAWPMNMMAGATTTYMMDFPISPSGASANAIDDGGYVKFTFPRGFNVANVIPDPYNPDKNDLNWDGPGTVVLKTSGVSADGAAAATKGGADSDGVTVNGQTVTVWLDTGGVDTGDPDFFHFEIKGIVNANIAQDFDTDGYTIDMKSYKADGTLLESKTSMPFFLSEAGSNNLTVNITATGGAGSLHLMAGSPMTGPLDADVTISSGTGSQTWSNLPDGCFHIFTEPTITLGSDKFTGQMHPEPICLPGSGAEWDSGTSTLTRALSFTKLTSSNAAQLPVKISGTFDAGGEDIDIFAGGPHSFTVETVTLTGTVVDNETTLFIPSDGNYMVGIGPAMPKGPMMGPPPMPDWMPPMPVNVDITDVGAIPIMRRTDTNDTITELSFTVGSANKQIIGRVISAQTTLASAFAGSAAALTVASASGFSSSDFVAIDDGTNVATGQIAAISGTTITLTDNVTQAFSIGAAVYNVITDAEIWAHQPMGFGGSGSYARSKGDGAFTLKVSSNGTYDVGAFKPGLGDAPMKPASVRDNDVATSDNNSTADIKIDGELITTSNPFLIKIYKPEYTISGKIMDANGNPMIYAPVEAKESTTQQMAWTSTDSDGDFVLWVSAGTWDVSAHMPPGTDTCGTISSQITVSSTTGNVENQNITPGSTVCYTIAGTITIGGTAQANTPLMIMAWDSSEDRPTGGYFRNETTDSSGNYSVKAGDGTYRISMWSPDYGDIGKSVTVNGADIASPTGDITYAVDALKTLTVSFTGGTSSMRGFVEAKETAGVTRRGKPVSDLSQDLTMSLPSGTYKVMVFVDGLGDFSPSADVDLTSNATVTIDISGETMHTVSGTVLDDLGAAVENATVLVVNETSGLIQEATTDSSGEYTMNVKQGTYSIKANHNDFSSDQKASIGITDDIDYDFDTDTTDEDIAAVNPLEERDLTITGTIYENDGSTAMTMGGTVWASNEDGERAYASIEEDGSYQLSVPDSTEGDTWTITADGPLHSETTYSTTVAITDSSASAKNITLTEDATDTKKSQTGPIVPSAGGLLDDTDTAGTGTSFQAGQGVLGSNGNTGSIKFEEKDVPATDLADPLTTPVEISVKTQGGTNIDRATGEGAEVCMEYAAGDLTNDNVDDESTLTLSYWDGTAGDWVGLDNVSRDTAANKICGRTTHLTTFAITHPIVVATQPRPYPEDDDDPTPAPPAPPIVTPSDPGDDEDLPEDEEELEDDEDLIVEAPDEDEEVVVAEENVIPERDAAPDLEAEAEAIDSFTVIQDREPTNDQDWKAVNFITYGTDYTVNTAKMSSRDRKGLLIDYKDTFGKLPDRDRDWSDVDAMARGERPIERNLDKEVEALASFIHVNKRLPESNDDWTFVAWIAYKMRPTVRDLSLEVTAIAEYRAIFNDIPDDATEWAIVRSMAYIDL